MPATTWKYVENQMESATRNSRPDMNRVVNDHNAKLTAAAAEPGADPALALLLASFTPAKALWDSAYSAWQNEQADYGGGTSAFQALLDGLTTSPGPDQTSKVEHWDSSIRAQVPKGGTTYRTLMPRGRASFNEGGRDEIMLEVKNLGTRLAAQTAKPALVALGTEVNAYWLQMKTARDAQQGMEGETDTDSAEIEAQRLAIATELYGNLGMLMHIYRANPVKVAGFFDLDTLRRPPAPPTPTPPVTP